MSCHDVNQGLDVAAALAVALGCSCVALMRRIGVGNGTPHADKPAIVQYQLQGIGMASMEHAHWVAGGQAVGGMLLQECHLVSQTPKSELHCC
jgi:hypothetical protein